MITGQLPFKGDYEQAVIYSIMNENPEQITTLRSEIPVSTEQVVFRALEKNPDKRYQTIDELLDDLKSISEGIVPEEIQSRMRKAKLRKRRKALLFAGAAGLVIISVLALTLFTKQAQAIDSIAVLPLENLSGDPEQDPIAEGIHDALITDLAGLGLKRVIARKTVMRYKGKNTLPKKIAQELNVKRLITGTVVRSGDRVRVTAQLINPATEAQEWAQNYERDLRNILSLQNEIVSAITKEVKLQLTPQEEERLANAPTVDPEAYVAYLKGRSFLNKMTPEGIAKGFDYMQQAIDKDPTSPFPYAGLALAYCIIGHGQSPPPGTFERAMEAVMKAEELGGTLAETEAAIGSINLYSKWDWAVAEKAFERALELNPSLSDARRNYSWYLMMVGKRDEAIEEMNRAIEVDPLAPLWSSDLGWQHWIEDRFEQALDGALKALELDPNFNQAIWLEGLVYSSMGRHEEAISVHQRLAKLHPGWKWALVRTYALAGRISEARETLDKFLTEGPKTTAAWESWFLVGIYAALGEMEKAIQWLEVAYEGRHNLLPWIHVVPQFRPLHSNPHFQDMVQKMNLSEFK
jgi:TolB-like protein/Tfp pilus assembly protein PilF